jgi:hypothetical protein
MQQLLVVDLHTPALQFRQEQSRSCNETRYAVQSEESFDFASFMSSMLHDEFATVVKFGVPPHPLQSTLHLRILISLFPCVIVLQLTRTLAWCQQGAGKTHFHPRCADVFMWAMVCIWVSFPEGSYGGMWLAGGFIILSIIAGAKLHVVAMHLSRHAYSRFYHPLSSKPLGNENAQSSPDPAWQDAMKLGRKAGPMGEAEEKEVDAGAPQIETAEVKQQKSGSSSPRVRRWLRGHSQRIKHASEEEHLMTLFWFGSPRILLRVFRCVRVLCVCNNPHV